MHGTVLSALEVQAGTRMGPWPPQTLAPSAPGSVWLPCEAAANQSTLVWTASAFLSLGAFET
jgi:hypothetical protein